MEKEKERIHGDDRSFIYGEHDWRCKDGELTGGTTTAFIVGWIMRGVFRGSV